MLQYNIFLTPVLQVSVLALFIQHSWDDQTETSELEILDTDPDHKPYKYQPVQPLPYSNHNNINFIDPLSGC